MYDVYSGKRQHICVTNCVTEWNKYPATWDTTRAKLCLMAAGPYAYDPTEGSRRWCENGNYKEASGGLVGDNGRHQCSGVSCVRRMTAKLKQVQKTLIRPAIVPIWGRNVLKLNDKKIGLRERKHRGRKQEHLTRLQLMYNVLPIITRGCLRKNLEWWRQTVEQKKTIISNFEPQERLGPAPYGSFVSPRIAMQVSPGISPV